ncbi:MAG: ATP-binding cassette domain-containing protein, partial [Pygmaiobacter sp.]
MSSFVTFEDTCKFYQMGETRIAAADHISFTIEKGEFCIIVGPSGAGKTTVLNMLGGMDTCDEGRIVLDGVLVSSYSKKRLTEYRRYDVGFVFQFYNLVQNLTALENVELASEICRDPLDAKEMLIEVGLGERLS